MNNLTKPYLYCVSRDVEGILKLEMAKDNQFKITRPDKKEFLLDNATAQLLDPEYLEGVKKLADDYTKGKVAGVMDDEEFVLRYLELFAKHLNMGVFMRCH